MVGLLQTEIGRNKIQRLRANKPRKLVLALHLSCGISPRARSPSAFNSKSPLEKHHLHSIRDRPANALQIIMLRFLLARRH